MSDYIQPTGGTEDTFYQVWQRVTGGEGKRTDGSQPEMPGISLNERLQRLLRQAEERERLSRSWQSLHRFVPLCRKERETLGTALFLRTGLRREQCELEAGNRDLPQDCRRLCLLFQESSRAYQLAAAAAEGQRLRQQLEAFSHRCHQAGEEAEQLLEEILKYRGYI